MPTCKPGVSFPTGLAVLAVLLTACAPSAGERQRVAELEEAAAQRDTLMLEVADLGRFVSDISTELADVSLEGSQHTVIAESPSQAERDSIIAKVKQLNTRVEESQTRLDQSRRRIAGLSALSDSLQGVLTRTVANYEQVLATQRETIATLTAQIDTLQVINLRLAAGVDTLTAAVDTLRAEASTVYYVAGTKEELLERGVIEEEGGSRVLFIFGKRGKTIVPARELAPSEFTPLNKYEATHIQLPDAEAPYRIASRHPLAYLASPINEDGEVIGGSLDIVAPDEFWRNSKFLIVVREG